jgi:tetratricopeptide (TPR) repeat protein
MSDPFFLVIYVGRDNAPSVKHCLGGIARQTYKRWEAIYVDDASEDNSAKEVTRVSKLLGLEDRLFLADSDERKPMGAHLWHFIAPFGERVGTPKEDEVTHIIVASPRFRFADDRALERIAEAHKEGWAVVWGRWRDASGELCEDNTLHPFEDVRQQPWVFSGPFSFEARYARVMTEDDLLDKEGEHFHAGASQAIGYAVCEATIKRRALRSVLFESDQESPLPYQDGVWRDNLMPEALKDAIYTLAARPSKEPRVDPLFFQNQLYSFMQMAFIAERHLSRRELSQALVGGELRESFPKPPKFEMSEDERELAAQGLSTSERRERLLLMDIEDVEMLAESGDNERALKLFRDLAEHAPDSARIQTNLGVLLWGMEEAQTAMKHFMLAIRHDRDNRDPVMNCAGAWFELGRLDQAKQICRDFLSRHPKDEPVKNLLLELESLS